MGRARRHGPKLAMVTATCLWRVIRYTHHPATVAEPRHHPGDDRTLARLCRCRKLGFPPCGKGTAFGAGGAPHLLGARGEATIRPVPRCRNMALPGGSAPRASRWRPFGATGAALVAIGGAPSGRRARRAQAGLCPARRSQSYWLPCSASSALNFATLALCSSSVVAKTWPSAGFSVLATKKM